MEQKIRKVIEEVKKAVVGKDNIIEKVFLAILARGHILIEDIPGVGKTTLAMAFSRVMDLKENRLQFTPDVLPTDIVGFNILSKDGSQFEYKEGTVVCNLFLADEINRTSSKTQSALLEVMEEGKVTVDGITRELPKPFVVIATQNPIGSIGTQMLPESQLDRFMVKLSMGYPDIQSEIEILKGKQNNNPMQTLNEVITKQELLEYQERAEKVFVHDAIFSYIANLVLETRTNELILLGVSPRGTIALTKMAKAAAFLEGREYVLPEDIRKVYYDVVAHRMILSSKCRVNHITLEKIVEDIVGKVVEPSIC